MNNYISQTSLTFLTSEGLRILRLCTSEEEASHHDKLHLLYNYYGLAVQGKYFLSRSVPWRYMMKSLLGRISFCYAIKESLCEPIERILSPFSSDIPKSLFQADNLVRDVFFQFVKRLCFDFHEEWLNEILMTSGAIYRTLSSATGVTEYGSLSSASLLHRTFLLYIYCVEFVEDLTHLLPCSLQVLRENINQWFEKAQYDDTVNKDESWRLTPVSERRTSSVALTDGLSQIYPSWNILQGDLVEYQSDFNMTHDMLLSILVASDIFFFWIINRHETIVMTTLK